MGATTRDPNVIIPVESGTPPIVKDSLNMGSARGTVKRAFHCQKHPPFVAHVHSLIALTTSPRQWP